MRIGYTTSVVGHAILLAWGLVTLPGAKPYEVEQIDALPVDLIPIDAVTALSEGSKTAPLADTASQAKIQNPVPRPDSPRVGAAPTDQDTPVTEKTTETAAAPTAEPAAVEPPPPPPKAPERPPEPVKEPVKAPEPAPEPEKAPEPEPAPPEPAPEPPKPAPPEPEPAPAKLAESGEIAAPPEPPKEAAPAPVPPSAKPRSKPAPPKAVAAAKPSETASDANADSPSTKPTDKKAPKRPAKAEKEFDPTEMAALLNKVDPSGGGGRTSERDASLGSERATGRVARMSQSELDALSSAIAACFNPPIGAENVVDLVVPLRVEFNIDGSVAGNPVVTSPPSDPVGRAIADAAVRAVRRCAPYSFLPPDKYDGGWETVNMNFRPPNSY